MKRVLFLFVFLATQVIPQLKWVPMTGFPYITPVDVSASSNGDVYAIYSATGTNLLSAVYVKYADSSFAWPSKLSKLNGTAVHAAGSNNVIIGDSYGRVYLSTDKGNTWNFKDLGGSSAVNSIVSNSYGEVFAVIGDKVHMSRDYGETWSLKVTGPRIISNERLGTIYGCKEGGLYRSTNYGDTWQTLPTGLTTLPNNICVDDAGYLYYTSTTMGTWRSTDQGATFTDISQGLFTTESYGLTSIPGVGLFCSNPYGIYKSTDRGNTWNIVCYDNSRNFISLVSTPQGHIYSKARFGGIYRSTDSGASWESVSAGFPSPYADKYTRLPSGLILASLPSYGVWGTSDYGVSWYKRDAGITANNPNSLLRRISALPGGELMVASNYSFYRSSDEGVTWTSHPGYNMPPTFDGAVFDNAGRVCALARDIGLAVPSTGIFEWTVKYSASANSTKCYALTISHDSSTVYFATNRNLVYSTDGMNTYTTAPGVMDNIRDIVITPGGRIFTVSVGKAGICLTTDNGTTWETRGAATLPACIYLAYKPDGRLFAASEQHGVFTSGDDGYTWEAVNEGLNDPRVQELYVAPNGEVWVSTLKTGMFKLTGLTSVKEPQVTGSESPAGFSLFQNYPNPFNPETIIRYALPVAGYARGVVYDILGKEVATLLDGEMQAGEHSVRFDASGLPSGVYILRMTAGKYSSAIKMVVAR